MAVDALRGAAAMAVVLYHARRLFFIGGTKAFAHGLHLDLATLQAVLLVPFRYGFLGVQLFFVLSGYCIHRSEARRLASDPGHRVDIGRFALRRIWRIYPTYLAALLLSAAVDLFLVGRGVRAAGEGGPLSLGSFLVSVVSLQGYLAPQFSSNGVFWTLAIELHLYAAYPLLHAISRRWGPWRALLLSLASATVYIVASAALDLPRFFPSRGIHGPVFLPYWFTWTAGFFIAECEAGRCRLPRGFAVLAGSGGLVGLTLVALQLEDFAEIGWALAFAGLVHWAIGPGGQRWLSGPMTRALATVGLFSYSLYALHAATQMALLGVIAPSGERFPGVGPVLLAATVSVSVAWLMFQLVERWSLKWPFGARQASESAAPSAGGEA